jgi:hypothetical protein
MNLIFMPPSVLFSTLPSFKVGMKKEEGLSLIIPSRTQLEEGRMKRDFPF